jgi:hypothetical protein
LDRRGVVAIAIVTTVLVNADVEKKKNNNNQVLSVDPNLEPISFHYNFLYIFSTDNRVTGCRVARERKVREDRRRFCDAQSRADTLRGETQSVRNVQSTYPVTIGARL